MSYQTYFMCTLTLPVVVGLIGIILPGWDLIKLIVFFAGIPYLLCAGILAFLIHRSRTLKRLIWLSILSPILMGAIMTTFSVANGPPELGSVSRLVQAASSDFTASAIVGYFFVAIVWIGFFVGLKCGLLIGLVPPNKALQTEAADPRR